MTHYYRHRRQIVNAADDRVRPRLVVVFQMVQWAIFGASVWRVQKTVFLLVVDVFGGLLGTGHTANKGKE